MSGLATACVGQSPEFAGDCNLLIRVACPETSRLCSCRRSSADPSFTIELTSEHAFHAPIYSSTPTCTASLLAYLDPFAAARQPSCSSTKLSAKPLSPNFV